jgi:hypothetical protein
MGKTEYRIQEFRSSGVQEFRTGIEKSEFRSQNSEFRAGVKVGLSC